MSTIPVNQKAPTLATILDHNQESILADWIKEMSGATRRSDLMKDAEVRSQCVKFLRLVKDALNNAGTAFSASAWDGVKEMLGDISRSRAQQGFTPSETAIFVLSVKKPLFNQIRASCRNDADALATETWATTELVDALGLHTIEVFQKSREEII